MLCCMCARVPTQLPHCSSHLLSLSPVHAPGNKKDQDDRNSDDGSDDSDDDDILVDENMDMKQMEMEDNGAFMLVLLSFRQAFPHLL